MARIIITLVSGLALAAALGCGPADSGGGATSPTPPASKPTPTPPPAARPTPPPPAAAANTYDCLEGNAQAGSTHYATYCSTCHGATGNGEGPGAAGLTPKPAKHTDGAYMNALSNEHLFKVIELGGAAVGKSPLMAPWGSVMNQQQIWDAVAHVRSLAKPPFSCP